MRASWTGATRIATVAVLGFAAVSAPLVAQVRTIDPSLPVDADLRVPAPAKAQSQSQSQYPPPPIGTPAAPDPQRYPDAPVSSEPVPATAPPPAAPADQRSQDAARAGADAEAATSQTFQQQELLAAAEGTFGKGASGLAGILERTLKEQGQPNAYIAGREASGAIVVGLRYGKGEMFHKVEGQQPVYWTGPSVGFDLGGDANKVFVLVYNLYDTENLYRRFPAAEGRVYFVGGFAATYLRRGNIVLIPIRLGVGWRQGVNIGYMKFSHKSRWLPF